MVIEQKCIYFECDVCFSKLSTQDDIKPPTWELISLRSVKGVYICLYACSNAHCKDVLQRISVQLANQPA